jgi:hypothetical protein
MVALIVCLALGGTPSPAQGGKTSQLVLDVKPAAVEIYVDEERIGKATKVWTVSVKPGKHTVKVVAGISSQEEVVTVRKWEKKTMKFDLTDVATPSQERIPAPSEGEAP